MALGSRMLSGLLSISTSSGSPFTGTRAREFSVSLPVEICRRIPDADSRWDLWSPPVYGGSYWTSSLQYRALVAGARLSRTIGRYDTTLGYDKVAPLVVDYLQESRL